MRKLTKFKKSTQLLFALLALLAGGASPAWAQQTLPYSYGFESSSSTTDGWTKTSCHSSTENYNLGVASGHGGSYVFRFFYNSNPPQYLISPELATSDKAIDVSFVYKVQSNAYEESFKVGYSTTDTETASFTFEDEVKTKNTTWTEYTTTLPAGTKYVCIAYTANNKYYLFIDDFKVEEAGAMPKPKSLSASDITASSATLSWTAGGSETSWEISYSTSSAVPADEGSYTSVNSTTYNLTGLSAQTTYYVYVRAKAGDEYSTWSEAYSFTTPQVAVAAEGYNDDFETACNWMLINGSNTNAWAWGSATNNGGSKALYISNDGGTTNAYTNNSASMVYATKFFSFAGGVYNFSFDWLGNGEGSYDFMRVALVPANVELTAGTSKPSGFSTTALPTGWIALDGGSKLNVQSSWQHANNAVTVEAGNYYVVFAWTDDTSGGTNPPAAIDNFSITVQTCPVPSNLTVTDIAARQATLNWATSSNTWEVYCTTEEGTPAADVTVTAANIATNSYTFTGLTPETKYYVWVRSVSGSDKSEWAGTDFTTDISCHAPIGLTVAEITSTGATLSWTSDADDFNVRYKKVSDADWTLVEGTISAKTYALTGLTPATAYQAQVRTYCDATDQSAWTDAASFTTDCAAVTEFPFAENFNGITAGIPDCWNNNEGTTNTINYRWSYYASGHDGACLRFNSYNNQNGITNMLKTPAMIFPSDKTMLLTFWYKNPAGGDFSVFISNDGGTTYTTELATGLTGVSAWTEKEIVLPADFTENVVIVFKGTSNYGSGDAYIYLDDVTIDEAPACAKPTALAAANVTAHSVELSWTNGSDEEAWQIAYGTTADFDADAATPVEVNTNPYTLTGLAANTSYYICVRAKKGSDVSAWSDKVNFTTEPSCITPTDFAVSTTTINSATLTWTDATEQSQWEVSYSTTSGAPEEGTIVAVTEKTYTIEGLTAGTTYYASVRAVNSDDDKSAWSSEISFIPGVVIANEGTTTNSYVPVYGYYADNTTGIRSQFIIPATSLTSVSGNQIDKIVFYCYNANKSWGNAEFDVYVKEVENTAFESTALTDWAEMTKVFSGKLSVSDSKMMIVEFADAFAYEGGNLMIGVCQTVKGSENSSSWYGITTSEYTALGGYATSINRYQFLPKTAIYYSPIVIAPKMAVSETELAYNLVAQNSVQTKTFTIENKGKADLTGITVSSNNAAFTVTEIQNQTIAVGGDAITVTVTFNTETAGEYDGTITISATGQEDAEITVSGTVRDANKIFIDFAENPMPATWSMASGWSVSNEMAYNSGTAANIISGEVVVAEGGENIYFDYKGVNTWGETYNYVKVYYATTGNDSEADWTLIDGATFGCTDNTTWYQAKVTVPANAKYICLQGKNIYIDNFYGLALPLTPYMVFSANDYNFGMITAATTTEAYTIQNTGKGKLTGLSIISDNDNFTVAVTDNATTISANSQATFTVTMKADTKGMQSGKITVKADGFEDIEFNVSGYVVDESKFYVTFDDNQQPEGWSENTGWTFANGNATPSTDAQITLPALTVAEGEKMAISVEATGSNPELFYYTSTDGGSTWSAKSANLASGVTTTAYSVVYIDGLEADDYKLKLQGYHIQIDALNGFTINANAPELFVTPTDNANFGTKIKAQPADKTYTIVNTGTGTLTGTITSSVTEHFTVSESEFSLAAGESITFNIALVFDENYGAKASTITIHPTNDGLSDVVINATATTADPNVWEEDFAAGIPTTWINENNAWTTTRYGHDGQAGPVGNNTATLTTPRLEATQDQVLTFDVIDAESETYFLKAEYSTDRKSWSLIENYTTAGSMSFTAPEDGYYYLRFTGNYTYVDNFYGFKEAPLDHDAAIAAIDIPTTGNQYVAYTATVTVKEMAGKAEELTAKFFIGETQYGENVVETIEANGTKTFSVVFTPEDAVSGEAYFTVSNDDLSLISNKVDVTIALALVLDQTVAPELTDDNAASVVVSYTAKAGWNTICMPFELTTDDMTAIFGENWKAYEFTSFNDGVLGFSATTTFFAGYPYLVYSGTPANTQLKKQNVTIDATVNNDERGTVTFQGTYAPMAAGSLEAKEGKIKYVVGTIDGKTKLYKATATTWMKGFRAYFDAPDNTQVKSMSFFDEATGVRTISAGSEEAEAIFDLMGRRMNEARKGVNIVNGKKVIIK